MSQKRRRFLSQLLSTLVGMVIVGLATGWSIEHPLTPSVFVEGRTYSFGTTDPGRPIRHSWIIRNGGKTRLKLRTRFTSGRCGFSLWLGQDYFVLAGETLTVSLTCPTPREPAVSYFAYADVLTNDPANPSLRFKVIGITGPALVP